ncbi:30S ribosomal protein S8 [Candidatus Gracilibacteria bacterium]|nr:30S ribosomal protein S8 [Candidatus Gracilibacteria bacterium]
MHTDPIADLLTRIRNAGKAQHDVVRAPYSTIKEAILKVMKKMKFIEAYKVEGEGIAKEVVITLKEDRTQMTIKRISKPGQRIYVKKDQLRVIKSGLGITILSTSKGIMTNLDAHREGIGGELLCEIY